MVEWLLQREAVHVIASDAHDPEYRRPTLSEARTKIAKLAGEEIADALAESQSRCDRRSRACLPGRCAGEFARKASPDNRLCRRDRAASQHVRPQIGRQEAT